MGKRRVFLVCPVRPPKAGFFKRLSQKFLKYLLGIDEPWAKTQKAIADYVAKLEADGAEVYWPARDTDQTDPHGWTICCCNRSAILDANEIHIWYDIASTGSKFDLGMVFVLLGTSWVKKVVIANPDAVKPTPYKSFENVLLRMQDESEKYFALCESIS